MRAYQDDFIHDILTQDEVSRKAEFAQKRKALSGAQKRIEELDKIIQRLYEDSVFGKLIDRIVIHNPERVDRRKHVTIEVFITYVGRIRIPLQKLELPTSKAQPA